MQHMCDIADLQSFTQNEMKMKLILQMAGARYNLLILLSELFYHASNFGICCKHSFCSTPQRGTPREVSKKRSSWVFPPSPLRFGAGPQMKGKDPGSRLQVQRCFWGAKDACHSRPYCLGERWLLNKVFMPNTSVFLQEPTYCLVLVIVGFSWWFLHFCPSSCKLNISVAKNELRWFCQGVSIINFLLLPNPTKI